ncbi:MAG: phosphoribosylformylglycinamidine synthase [Clostridiales bacterium]|nr:phosphoribosylformylglycinamidine synthase [Clostridiales bacterium]MDN5298612.1 phosphoribosylformylglycinamidine synthase [Clostridiales bacterium]
MVTRIMVEKKSGFDVEALGMLNDIKATLHMPALARVRVINCYDIEDVEASNMPLITQSVLSEPNVDAIVPSLELASNMRAFRMALLPGQFDQRADSAAQCIELVTLEARPELIASKIIVLEGILTDEDFLKIKQYLINPVESHEVAMAVPEHVGMTMEVPASVATVEGFAAMDSDALETYRQQMGFAMTIGDLVHVQQYFKDEAKRNPTVTELKVIDTYWSDHCRHTTFLTEITDIHIEESLYTTPVQKAYDAYCSMRSSLGIEGRKAQSLMDLATINTKALRAKGGLQDLDVSDEINACSIEIDVDVNGVKEPWLLMFKNETHNHPTEIEPFGGAATCLGGAIRDPLSGRSYVYQSMRVTGAADPRVPFEETLDGKLPQKVITQKAAAGFSAYGNQIGLATGHVAEVYDPDFVAKRMEVGAVMGAAPKANVVREVPEAGDIILLVGGRTGRDGIGGATGSSKEHTEDSLMSCGAEVQKGNAPVERKIQRLFRIPELARMIKRCNDFGAGGVSVAIGELADSLEINLDAVTKKYEGLDGTEIAISESQERMAVVVAPEDVERFQSFCANENLEVKEVAKVTDTGRLIMKWRGEEILNLSRAFLDTNGVKGQTSIIVEKPDDVSYFDTFSQQHERLETIWLDMLSDLNCCSQKGLVERFDNTIGAGTVLMPFGGNTQQTPAQVMVAKLPLLKGETDTVSMMSYGYDPKIGKWSPFHGGMYAVLDSIAKLVAAGADYQKIRLSLQEYFEKLGENPTKWGKPFSALLGASYVQTQFETAAIGGKDSMSGTFKAVNVPPTLISFAVAAGTAGDVVTPELKQSGNVLLYLEAGRDHAAVPAFESLKAAYQCYHAQLLKGRVQSAHTVGYGGIAVSVSKMSFGNGVGLSLMDCAKPHLFEPAYGGIVFEVKAEDVPHFDAAYFMKIGETIQEPVIKLSEMQLPIDLALAAWSKPLQSIFPEIHKGEGLAGTHDFVNQTFIKSSFKAASPKVFIPAFPGTNCEWDTQIAFEKAGATPLPFLFKNLSKQAIVDSLDEMVKLIDSAQMIALPGGFSAGDEPEGSGKFIASVFRNPNVAEAVMRLIYERDGLVIGICNGFQALIKLGLLPYGDIRTLDDEAPTLTFNKIGRHVAKLTPVRVASTLSPWLYEANVGDVVQTAFSHGEGRFYASDAWVRRLSENGQIATQYVDLSGQPTYDGHFNINGSVEAIEGITSANGRIFGKMGHSERIGKHLYKNVYGEKDLKIFKSGVNYFK